jgi:hypothetical protein
LKWIPESKWDIERSIAEESWPIWNNFERPTIKE